MIGPSRFLRPILQVVRYVTSQSDTVSRIVSLTMVKNEQDIIEPMIRHTARLVDMMVVLDNASIDDTRQIAIKCAQELGNVVVCDSDDFAYAQSDRMTAMFRHVQSAVFADFILLLDADEFLSAADRKSLERALRSVPTGGVGYVAWRTLVLSPKHVRDRGDDPLASLTHCRAVEKPPYFKVVLRPNRATYPDWSITQGNHDVSVTVGEPLPSKTIEDLVIYHAPVRGKAQIVSKAVVGWMAYLALNPEAALNGQYGYQWRHVFEGLLQDPSGPNDDSLCELSMHYAQRRKSTSWKSDARPVALPTIPPRRHSTGTFADPLVVIARSWARSLTGKDTLIQLDRPSALDASSGSGQTAFEASWHWDNLFWTWRPSGSSRKARARNRCSMSDAASALTYVSLNALGRRTFSEWTAYRGVRSRFDRINTDLPTSRYLSTWAAGTILSSAWKPSSTCRRSTSRCS